MRARLIIAGVVSALSLVLALLIARDERRAPAPTSTVAPTASPPAVSPPEPAHPTSNPTSAPGSSSPKIAPAADAATAPDDDDPEHDDSWKLVSPHGPFGEGDPFEPPDAEAPIARLLGRSGTIRFGVLKDAKVTNEAALRTTLARLAAEIDRLDRDRSDQPHKRMPEYEAIVKKAHDELRPHVDGAVMIASGGWSLAVDVVDKP